MLKSKIFHATVTAAELHYKGSISIDQDIIEKADLKENEKVEVLNLHNGSRLETYVIRAKRASGTICLNGPAARLGHKGDKIIILSYGLYTEEELKKVKPVIVELDEKNRIKNTYLAR
jgi:aspartate 1-decarboxylase